MKITKKIVITLIGLIIILAGAYYLYQIQVQINNLKEVTPSSNNDQTNMINYVTFNCSENKTISAIFFNDKAEITLSDKRSFLLFQAISASGVRYVNSDESVVFWNKGQSGFIEENGKTTFDNCATTNN